MGTLELNSDIYHMRTLELNSDIYHMGTLELNSDIYHMRTLELNPDIYHLGTLELNSDIYYLGTPELNPDIYHLGTPELNPDIYHLGTLELNSDIYYLGTPELSPFSDALRGRSENCSCSLVFLRQVSLCSLHTSRSGPPGRVPSNSRERWEPGRERAGESRRRAGRPLAGSAQGSGDREPDTDMEETAVRGETPGETENRPEAAESWYQLLAQEDASVMPTLSETDAHVEHTDLPSMEEGSLQLEIDLGKPTSAGRTRSLYLDIQDSRLSPCLPLLTSDSTPGHKFFEDTLFHHTETDFAPLRGSLDISEFPGSSSKLLQMSDAVELANKEILLDQVDRNFSVSQHYLGVSPDGAGDVSSVQYLSQHPLSFSHGDKGDHILTEYAGNESGVLKPVASQEIIKPSIEELRREDGSFLGSNVPAPVLLELLEKEVAMSGSSGASSRRSSQSVSENIDVQQQEPVRKQHKVNWSEPRVQADTGSLSESLLQEGSFADSSEKVVLDIMKREKVDLNELNEFNQSGGVVHQSIRQTVQPNKDDLHKQMCSEIQQRYQEKEMSKAIENRRESSSPRSGPVLTKSCTETPYKSNDTVEAHSSDETAISSRSSIERGHKDTEMSHAGNTPMDETSFIDKLAHPISQSTPGTFSMNRKHLSGRIQQIKAKLTGSEMSLDEEPSGGSSNLNVVTKVVPQSVQSSQGYPESSDSQRSLSPQRRRIQSLPSLNYIEKVGAWNTNQSFDALVLRGLTGVSPKKLAFDAVASSLNRMLSKQTSGTVPKKGLAASFKCTSSMSNLDVGESESSTVSQLTRSQSYNSVIPVSGKDTSEMWTGAAVQPVAEEVHQISRSNKVQSYKALRGVSTIPSRDNNEVEQNNRAPSVGLCEVSEVQSRPECPKTEDKSHHKQEKELDKSTLNHRENIVTMDQFSDVSLDHEFSSSSNSNDLLKEMLLDSAASSKHELTSLDVDNFVPFWAPTEKTPEVDELNIEDRIPMYLRNLGINQSPKTILTPFAPKGPIREPEFSPTDLRTIKGSTATPTRSMRLSDGASQTGANISQSSLYSSASTTSVSIPMGSVAGPESPLATETSPQFTTDRPISQDDFVTKDVQSVQEVFSFLTLAREKSEMSPDIQPTIDVNSAPPVSQVLQYDESTHVKQLIEQFEYGGYDRGQENTGNLGQVSLSSLQSASKQPLTMDSVNDSFVGAKTLKEIRKLLAEADDVGLDRTTSGLYLTSPLRDSVSPPVGLNLEDSLKSETLNSRSASPLDLLLKDMSWDTSFNSSVTSDDVVKKVSSVNAELHFGDHSANGSLVKDISYLAELVEDRHRLAPPVTLHKRWGRSEPEGSSEASANKVMASTVQVQDHLNKGQGDAGDGSGKVQRTEQLISSVTSSVGNLKHALALTGGSYIRGREVESDESSGDSLAARITSLLKTDTPFPSAGRVIQTTEEDGGRPQRSVKLRLVSQPTITDTDLSEEDRRRIEEIKRALLDGAKRAVTDRCYSHVGSRERLLRGTQTTSGYR
ncbi:uncharacterized protein LOC142110902 [Mixophyes fleayi]|uniref:uncharacterized protein LOC142110902 n=1 Tax=Mixophyes fleayi TaxID=3061075 RepID=UPI003F4E244C